MKRLVITLLLVCESPLSAEMAATHAIPASFAGHGEELKAIQKLLDTYTKAVSEKNQPLFESILLGLDIPFSDILSVQNSDDAAINTRNYPAFRQGVFYGPAFKQHFKNVHIEQNGPLAQVSLTFINTSKQGSERGWKTLQLLKVKGRWKIASEFYLNH